MVIAVEETDEFCVAVHCFTRTVDRCTKFFTSVHGTASSCGSTADTAASCSNCSVQFTCYIYTAGELIECGVAGTAVYWLGQLTLSLLNKFFVFKLGAEYLLPSNEYS